MQGSHIAAAIATFLSLGIIGTLLLWKTPRKDWNPLFIIILLELPMSLFAFYLIRLPLDKLLLQIFSPFTDRYRFLTTFYAPLTEEPIKLWVLLIPWLFHRINIKNRINIAVAIGVGFGIGELWMLAHQFSKVPSIAQLPWYSFGGYIQERFLVCFMHGAFTASAIIFFRKKFFIPALLLGMFLHYLGNFPIFLAAINFGGIRTSDWKIIISLWVQLYFLLMLGFMGYLLYKQRKKGHWRNA